VHTNFRPTNLRSDAGFVLPTAIGVLFVILLLTAAGVTASFSTSNSTTRDEHQKAALEAAEAGLRVAAYRLNMLGPEPKECLAATTLVKEVTSEATQCVDSGEALGNGGKYQYWTTTELKKGSTCVGIVIKDPEEERSKSEGIEQRCVTSVGTVNGVQARVEARVSSFTAEPVFPIEALIGLEQIKLEGNSDIKGAVASNGKVYSNGSAFQEGGCILGPSASFEGVKTTCEATSQRTVEEGKVVVGAIQPGSSAKGSETGTCEEQTEPKYNCNFLIENGIFNSKRSKGEAEKTPADEISGNVTYAIKTSKGEETREMTMDGGSWTLNGYIYNFCNFTATGNATINVNPKVKAEIFIEAPESEEPGSKCPPGSGQFNFTGTVNNPSGNPTALQIYVYGKGPVTYNGNTNTSLVLDAPNAPVSLSGNATITGGIIGSEVTASGNFGFIWSQEVKKLKAGPAGATTSYYRTAWAQCPPTVTTSSPMAGC
jgi:hypothetical protein